MKSSVPAGPTALFVSPHLDDVAFSCGGTVAALRRAGWRVAVATVFTASLPEPKGFALACQLDKGLPPDVDYMALRRREDAAFAEAVGVDDLIWLDLPEAPHRGYESARALFDAVQPSDAIAPAAARAIGRVVDRTRPDLIFAPQALGGHVDHRQVVRAILALSHEADRVAWYRDLPYAEKRPDALADPALPANLVEVPIPLEPGDLSLKLDGCACYASQVPFQFGDAPAMRRRLGEFAGREASRFDRCGHAETFLAALDTTNRLKARPIIDRDAI